MNALPKQEIAVVQQADSSTLIQIISRAASDPAVDIDKMERLMQMHERMVARNAEMAFNVAMTSCQSEMRAVSADATNPQTHSKYATYAKLDQYLRPIYTKHGFSLSFDEAESSKIEHVRVVCYVAHNGGHIRNYHRDMPADGKGAKGGDVMTKTHAAGAAGSYGARYLLKGIFNVAVGEADNDGNDDEGGMPEGQIVDFIASMEAATTLDELQKAYSTAYRAATKAEDKRAMGSLARAKDVRKDALRAKAAA